jgi:hypothetical protein
MWSDYFFETTATTYQTKWYHNLKEYSLILQRFPRYVVPQNILTAKENSERGKHDAQKHYHRNPVESTFSNLYG